MDDAGPFERNVDEAGVTEEELPDASVDDRRERPDKHHEREKQTRHAPGPLESDSSGEAANHADGRDYEYEDGRVAERGEEAALLEGPDQIPKPHEVPLAIEGARGDVTHAHPDQIHQRKEGQCCEEKRCWH
ncbi:hypothetical protein GCM10025866_33760 [Naasia aerilata]|uniref:Uncharacterized protein n=1 Tax=Naasia aerilata TaxID=1162966 RepID=A0ABN6XR33_9MICO|nr:hypothetical protein GCM10025866_33760 [Naasia aerilata]